MSEIVGRKSWSGGRDGEGHRTYYVVFTISCDRMDGPATILQTPGLPYYGQPWIFDDDHSYDVDTWAFCKMPIELTPDPGEESGEPATTWHAKFMFTTKTDSKRCHEEQLEDPLLIPDRISGASARYTEEATVDRFGKPLQTSSFEQLRGPQVEFDANRDTIRIEQNVSDLQYPLLISLRDTVNREPIWGMPSRTVKFSSYTWERRYYGACEMYYVRTLEFETAPNGFDRDILDEGTKVLNGHWNPDVNGTGSTTETDWILDKINGVAPNPGNPEHFIRFKDRNGENCKVVLNGAGIPSGAVLASGGPYFVAVNGGGVENKGNAVSNSTWWRRLFGDPANVEAFIVNPFYSYGPGRLVTSGADTWISVVKTEGSAPAVPPPGETARIWFRFPGGLTSVGAYDRDTVYVLGDYVSIEQVPTTAGYIHVEKYWDGDFLLLAIPTDL